MSRSLEEMLIEDNRRLRDVGCALAEASLRVIRTYDGVHRLALAVGAWSSAIACEGGREHEPLARQRLHQARKRIEKLERELAEARERVSHLRDLQPERSERR